jgi:hypothetical protein
MATNKTSLQQDNGSWESLPQYDVDSTPVRVSADAPGLFEKLKARLASIKEARDNRANLYEIWERKRPTYYAKQTYPIVESYPPHRAEYARQLRHQSWYPHFEPSISTVDSDPEPDSLKIEELMKERRHQSWYPHYKVKC